ncbi:MAG: hypothetical protein E4H13_09185 [Calditrichales bacterium]|nr:MAG: hypothetical protein E4H13_09185 [Calditrichales bacterium]
MLKIVLESLGKFAIREIPQPVLTDPHSVLIQVAFVGICGSDIHYYKSGRIGDQVIKYPFTPGHECTGIVSQTGSAVRNVKAGDRVVIEPAIHCGKCDQCLSGRKHTCRHLQFIGNPVDRDGCLQSFIVVPETCCYQLPESVSLQTGIMVEPLTIALHALSFKKNPGHTAILGLGPIGISTLLALKPNSDDKIMVTDKLDTRFKRAEEIGVDAFWNPGKTDVVSELLRVEPLGMDTVIECCGEQEALDQAVKIIKPGGTLIVVGIPETGKIDFDLHALRRKEVSIFNVRRQNENFIEAIERLSDNIAVWENLVTHQFTGPDVQKAFDLVAGYQDNVLKAVIRLM